MKMQNKIKTPNLNPTIMDLDLDYVNKLLGMEFSRDTVKELLEGMRYGVELKQKIRVSIPSYRVDILHPMDLVEDIAIAWGYERFHAEFPEVYTIGKQDVLGKFSNDVMELMIGFGFQEVMTLIMTNKVDLFERMTVDEEEVTETENPISIDHSVARGWLLPSLMNVLEKNKTREYPQYIFEIGKCITANGKTRCVLSGVIAHSKTNFSEIKSIVIGLLDNLDIEPEIKELEHNSFIRGRCADTSYGFFGEINPEVLENFNLEVPVTGFELDLDLIYKYKYESNI